MSWNIEYRKRIFIITLSVYKENLAQGYTDKTMAKAQIFSILELFCLDAHGVYFSFICIGVCTKV